MQAAIAYVEASLQLDQLQFISSDSGAGMALLLGPHATKKISNRIKNASFKEGKEKSLKKARKDLKLPVDGRLSPTDPRFLRAVALLKAHKIAELEHLVEERQLQHSLSKKALRSKTLNRPHHLKKMKRLKE